jgi:hypothetical protein
MSQLSVFTTVHLKHVKVKLKVKLSNYCHAGDKGERYSSY